MGGFEGLVGRRVGMARRAKPKGNRRAWTFGWIPEEELVREESGHRDFWDRYSVDPPDFDERTSPQRTRHGWVSGPERSTPAGASAQSDLAFRASPPASTPGKGVRSSKALRVDIGKAGSAGAASPVSVLSPYASPPFGGRGGAPRRASSAGSPVRRTSAGRAWSGAGTSNFRSQSRDDAKKRFHGEFEGVLGSPGTPPPGAYDPDFRNILERSPSANLTQSFQTGGCPPVTEQILGNTRLAESRSELSISRGPKISARKKRPQPRYGASPDSPSRQLRAYQARLGTSHSETDISRPSPAGHGSVRAREDQGGASGRLADERAFSKPSSMTPEYAAFMEHKLRMYKSSSSKHVKRGLAFD